MNGIWVRSENGRFLMLLSQFWTLGNTLKAADPTPAPGYDPNIILATFESEEAALRQLDDIQTWMSEWTAITSYEYEDRRYHSPRVYDLRERKVKEEQR